MSFRSQYLADIGLVANPYPNNPAHRIQSIYRTVRLGQINNAFAMQLWNAHLQPVHSGLTTLPTNQAAFDNFIVQTALAVEGTLNAAGKGGFGVAQKIINLFMKDVWAFHLTPLAADPFLHVPIDCGVLGKLRTIPVTWKTWTGAVAGISTAPTVNDYLAIQASFRSFLAAPTGSGASRPIFASVIEMDQFLWHKI